MPKLYGCAAWQSTLRSGGSHQTVEPTSIEQVGLLQKAGMSVTLDLVSRLVLLGELKFSRLLISFSTPKTRCFSKSIDGFLDMPDCVGLDNVHLHQDW